MLVPVLWFVLGLILLIKGGDWFVDGAAGVAKKFHIPDLLIGATVVSIGTTLPEVMVSASSAAIGHGQMAYGNAIGSIICNTSLVAAITIAIKPAKVDKKSMIVPVIFYFISAAFYAGTAYVTGTFSRPVGFILLAIFLIYMVINVKSAMKSKNAEPVVEKSVESTVVETSDVPSDESKAGKSKAEKPKKEKPIWLLLILLVVGAALIAWGANLLVDNGIIIAEAFGVPETVIALTFVALGTSLPELVTAVTSLIKGHGALSVGNICGANLFNLVLVSGLSVAIGPFSLADAGFAKTTIAGIETYKALLVDTPLIFVVMGIMTIPVLVKGKLSRWQGVLLLCIYVAFCAYQFIG